MNPYHKAGQGTPYLAGELDQGTLHLFTFNWKRN